MLDVLYAPFPKASFPNSYRLPKYSWFPKHPLYKETTVGHNNYPKFLNFTNDSMIQGIWNSALPEFHSDSHVNEIQLEGEGYLKASTPLKLHLDVISALFQRRTRYLNDM